MADDREPLGRLVRETWVACVVDYFKDPKLSWVTPWDELDDFQREADMRIGEAVAAAERERIVRWLERRGGQMAPGPDREALLGAAEALEDRSDEKEPGHA